MRQQLPTGRVACRRNSTSLFPWRASLEDNVGFSQFDPKAFLLLSHGIGQGPDPHSHGACVGAVMEIQMWPRAVDFVTRWA